MVLAERFKSKHLFAIFISDSVLTYLSLKFCQKIIIKCIVILKTPIAGVST